MSERKTILEAIRDYVQEQLGIYYNSLKGTNANNRFVLTTLNDYISRNSAYYNTDEEYNYEITNWDEPEKAFSGQIDLAGDMIDIEGMYAATVFIPISLDIPIKETYTDAAGNIVTIDNLTDVWNTIYDFINDVNATTIVLKAAYKNEDEHQYKLTMNFSLPSLEGVPEPNRGDTYMTISFSINGNLTDNIIYGDDIDYYLATCTENEDTGAITIGDYTKLYKSNSQGSRDYDLDILQRFNNSTAKANIKSNVWTFGFSALLKEDNPALMALFEDTINKPIENRRYALKIKFKEKEYVKIVVAQNIISNIVDGAPISLDFTFTEYDKVDNG